MRSLSCALLWIISIFHPYIALSGGEFRAAGGRAAGMSGVAVAVIDPWSAINNQAGCSWSKGISVGASFENLFLLGQLSQKVFYFTVSGRFGAFSVTGRHTGTAAYNEVKGGLSYSKKFGAKFSAGIQLNYYRFGQPADYISVNLMNCEGGAIFMPVKTLVIGFHCMNPVPVKLSRESGESLPGLYRLGVTYFFLSNLFLSAEIGKSSDGPAKFRIGSECLLAGKFSIRAGFSTSPSTFSMGAGVALNRFSFDIATAYNLLLGFSPCISLQYQFSR